jgi:hypothetical protein
MGWMLREAGIELPLLLKPRAIKTEWLYSLLAVLPYTLAAAFAVVFYGHVRNQFRAHMPKSDNRWRPVGMDRLARDAALDPERIEHWQHEQILYVEHGPLGRVTNACTAPPDLPGPG